MDLLRANRLQVIIDDAKLVLYSMLSGTDGFCDFSVFVPFGDKRVDSCSRLVGIALSEEQPLKYPGHLPLRVIAESTEENKQ
jgi:hypothetical protein